MPSSWIPPLMAAVLVGAATLGVVAFEAFDESPDAPATDAGAREAALRGGLAGDPDGHQHQEEHAHASHRHDGPGMDRPSFPPAEGSVPTNQGAQSLEQVSRIRIVGDNAFTPSNGVRSGNGTLDDPFVITGYYVSGDLYVQDTDACFVVRENWVGGQLTLNWNGQCVHVHHNHVRDLRVNENIRRTGYATGGLLELNEIEVVGQLRHYDGEFRDNVVGPKSGRSLFDPVRETAPYLFHENPRVANVDGFNQGLIHHNTFHGSVDLDFHGHHHGSGFFAPHSHYHGDNQTKLDAHAHDHTLRWTSVEFTDNRVIDPEGYGVRYEDRNHAADDRTARSEQVDELEEYHKHWTRIVIARNVVEGAPIWVDVFHADDDRHDRVNEGTFELVDNQITVKERMRDGPAGLPFFGSGHSYTSGLRVHVAKEVDFTISGNQLEWEPAEREGGPLGLFERPPAKASAIDLDGFRRANITVADNTAKGFHYGVKAHEFDAATHWSVLGCDFGDAEYAVYYDESVANRPEGSP